MKDFGPLKIESLEHQSVSRIIDDYGKISQEEDNYLAIPRFS
jgi:hypothetical protein